MRTRRIGEVMRVASLIFAGLPFAVTASFLLAIGRAEGWDGLRILLILLAAIPVLLILSIVSVVLAFKKLTFTKYENPALEKAARVLSITSVSLFGIAASGVVLVFIVTQIHASQLYSQYGL